MDILIRQARIIDPSSPFHQQVQNIFIQKGSIVSIGSDAPDAGQVIDIPGLVVTPGFADPFAQFCDPGFEYRETLESGARAAVAGGYTDVLVLPNTAPVVHNKAGVSYLKEKSRNLPVGVHPIAAVTKNTEGKELAEMYDMHDSGAVAFSDGTAPIQSAGLLLKALQYVKAIDKVIIQLPDDGSIAKQGLMNEGIVSTRLGLPGKPAIAEELMIRRDMELAAYTGSRIHLSGISTARGIDLIREAKDKGVQVTCSVTPAHLWFCDEDLLGYDTYLKLNPPLRTSADRDALRVGVLDGTVDCIASHHLPQDTDHKIVEFEYAQFGMIGLETAFAVVRTVLPDLKPERLVEIFSTAPRRIFGLDAVSIKTQAPARLTLLEWDAAWTPQRFQSLSQNTPFTGTAFTGRPAGIIHKDRVFLNQF